MTFRLPVERILFPANVPAGMDLTVIAALVMAMRKTTEDHEPIVVRRCCGPDDFDRVGLWRICDGRHRFVAAVVGGRHDVLCIEG